MIERVYRRGDRGPAVAQIASLLTGLGLHDPEPQPEQEHLFGDSLDGSVRNFQQRHGLIVDGIVGPQTYRRLDEARWRLGDRVLTHLPGSPLAGDDVFTLQRRLLDLGFAVGRVDGIFGPTTERGVREFQRNVGIPPDGTCGPATLKALSRLNPIVSGGRPNAMRAQERIHEAGPQLAGKVVVIDPADTPELEPADAARAREVVVDLARRVEGRLVPLGVQALLTRPVAALAPTGSDLTAAYVAGSFTEADRAAFANRTDAHLCLSLHVDASPNPDASGIACYFYGIEEHGVWSSTGERIAGLVQREVVARTDLTDLRIHPKTWDLLRRTRMPAVRVDLGYVTNAHDARRLQDPMFRDVLAEAIVVAVQRFYLAPENDSKTGVMRLSELRAALRELDG